MEPWRERDPEAAFSVANDYIHHPGQTAFQREQSRTNGPSAPVSNPNGSMYRHPLDLVASFARCRLTETKN
jgi:hypothetical protein